MLKQSHFARSTVPKGEDSVTEGWALEVGVDVCSRASFET